MDGDAELLLAARPCAECLTSKRRIVSGDRAGAIIRGCRARDLHFRCHKGDAAGLNVHCRGVHEIAPSQAYRFAVAIGIPIQELDMDALSMVHGL